MEQAKSYNRIAEFYDALASIAEWFISKNRKKILQLARGHILEVGVGTGNSFKDYSTRKQMAAVDVSKEMLLRAGDKLKAYDGDVELVLADIGHLPFGDGLFETVFSSLVLCSTASPVRKLKEMRRVAKQDCRLLMIEHVKSKNRFLGYWMEKLNPLGGAFG